MCTHDLTNITSMVTIYLDKQVFSHLFKGSEEKYRQLRENIYKHRDEFIFLYSEGHILDLQNDTTDIKFKELEFIRSIVGNHCLIYHSPYIQVATIEPAKAFEDRPDFFDTKWIEDLDWDNLMKDQKEILCNIADIVSNEHMGNLSADWITERKPLENRFDEISKEQIISANRLVLDKLYQNKDVYKQVRDNTISLYNPKQIRLDDKKRVDDAMLLTRFKSPFKDIIGSVMKQMGFKNPENMIVYTVAYILLDMIGLSPEKRGKIEFRNMHIDGIHSYFASYCDCFVSNDEGVRVKSGYLYNEFNMDTHICDIDEFIELFDKAIENNKKTARTYLDEIIEDHSKGEIIRHDHQENDCFIQLKTNHTYFGYFDQLIERTSDGKMSIVLCKRNGLNQSLLLEEIKIIVNRIALSFQEFGTEAYMYSEKDSTQLMEDSWGGRVWRFRDSIMDLGKVPGMAQLCFIIIPFGEA